MLTESVCIAGYLFGGTKMKIELKEIPVREIVKDFVDNQASEDEIYLTKEVES